MCDTTTAAAQCVGRTQHDRITDRICEFDTVIHGLYDERSCYRLTDLFHCILKFLTILCFLDRLSGRSDQTHAVLCEKSALRELHTKVQTCLSTECRQDAVRFFF